MKFLLKSRYLLVVVLFVCFYIFACKNELSKEQSEKHLKAFDSELITMLKQLSETNAFKAFDVMLSYNNLPLPFKYPEHNADGIPIAFDFQKKKGIYKYDKDMDDFMLCGLSDSIVIIFPFRTGKDTLAKCIIANYKEELSVWGVMFPTIAEIKLEHDNRILFDVKMRSELAYQVPVKSEIIAEFDKFKLNAHLKTKLTRSTGKIKLDLEILKRDEQYFKANARINSKITEQQSMIFDEVLVKCNVYPIKLVADVDYGDINTDSHNFVEDFNNHSSIQVYSNKNDHVGEIKLKEREGSDRLNFVVEYNDSSFTYLEDFLLSFREIMNKKIN